MKDWRGTTITVGCHVLYVSRHGSAVWLNEARVTDTQNGKLQVTALRSNGWRRDYKRSVTDVTLTALENVTVIKEADDPIS